MRAGRAAALVISLLTAPSFLHAGQLPDGFVYLADVAPHIYQDMRYAGARNFTGATVPGYKAAECILAEPAAQALSAASNLLGAQGYGLKVFDCYRPAKAVRHFVQWAKRGEGYDPRYHPRTDRKRLIAEGYIAARSAHSSGYAVDLTLTDADGRELDMGTPFDFFDPLSSLTNVKINNAAQKRRMLLFVAMRKAGLDGYIREWWHFSFANRPANAPIHDFDIVPRRR